MQMSFLMDHGEVFLRAIQERLINHVKQLKAEDILFHAKFEVPFGHKSKKNGKTPFVISPKSGRPFATLPTRRDIKQAENFYMLQLRSQANRIGIHKPIPHGVRLWGIFHFYFKNYYVKDKATKEKRISGRVNDLSNLYELPQDALQKAGIIEDDNMIVSHDLSRRFQGDRNEIEMFLIKYNDKF